MKPRYNIVTGNFPEIVQKLGFVAYVTDACHPQRLPGDPVSWHTTMEDAERTKRALELEQQTDV